jgi:hypothetical protein
MGEGNRTRRWKTATVLALGAVIGTMLVAQPAGAHFLPDIGHIWSHIKPKADARYANAVAHTDKAKNAAKVEGQRIVAFKHTSAAPNISSDCTYVDNPILNGNATAHVVAIHEYSGYVNRVFGVFYSTTAHKWCIYVEDAGGMPAGVTFRVIGIDPPGPASEARAPRLGRNAPDA